MGSVAQLVPTPPAPPRPPASSGETRPQGSFHFFEGLVVSDPGSLAGQRSATFSLSLLVHVVLLAAVIIVPLLAHDVLPAPQGALQAFFVQPQEVAAPPPPPPPPAAGPKVMPKAPVKVQAVDPARFVAPIEVPNQIQPETNIDFGIEGGVPGGVEGGVPGGVVGGVVGGIPDAAPPPAKVVRVGGMVHPPKLLVKVPPEYPPLAASARVQSLIILEARVGLDGRVKDVKVLRGHPLFDESALAAVRQWRYQPLLLNGEPTEFILTVTVMFNLQGGVQ
jgi:protein TonB